VKKAGKAFRRFEKCPLLERRIPQEDPIEEGLQSERNRAAPCESRKGIGENERKRECEDEKGKSLVSIQWKRAEVMAVNWKPFMPCGPRA
jgi:hypothetical protein